MKIVAKHPIRGNGVIAGHAIRVDQADTVMDFGEILLFFDDALPVLAARARRSLTGKLQDRDIERAQRLRRSGKVARR
ncbi:hypothetical protein CCR78_04730 [Rhodovulum imhoffii]|nr:hypothetical protein [Rhodovulum imhoffii]